MAEENKQDVVFNRPGAT